MIWGLGFSQTAEFRVYWELETQATATGLRGLTLKGPQTYTCVKTVTTINCIALNLEASYRKPLIVNPELRSILN